MAHEDLFEELPTSQLLPWELQLREGLLAAAAARPGRPFPVLEWIDRRIGGELETRIEQGVAEVAVRGTEEPPTQTTGPPGPVGIRANSAAGREAVARDAAARLEQFFAKLPGDSFTPQEEALRMAIFQFLAEWPFSTLTSLQDVAEAQSVKQCCGRLLAKGVTLRDWVERRIGQEVELVEEGGKDIINIFPEARAIITKLHEQMLRRRTGPPGQPAPPAGPPPGAVPARTVAAATGQKEAFFSGLPENELTDDELNLRQALLDHLQRRPKSPTFLVDVATNKEVQKLKSVLLPQKVTLRDWIDRRIGGEIECRKHDDGKIEIILRNGQRVSKAAVHERKPPDEDKKEQFWASIPEDMFTPEEEKLRESLIDFLERWEGDGSPTLSKAGGDEAVSQAKKELLGTSTVSMKEWIDRRIGGEVETAMDAKNQVAFGYRGQLQLSVQPPPGKKRRT